MKSRIYTIVISLLLCLYNTMSYGQSDLKKHVKKLIETEKYFEALDVINGMKKDDKEYYYNRGICHYYTNKIDLAISDLSSAYEQGKDDKLVLKYLALSHHKNEEFYQAGRAYKLYLNELDKKDPERYEIITAIKNCGYASKAKFSERSGFVENLGSVVNSRSNEFAPVRSPNFDNKYYYSSDRKGSTGGLRNDKGLRDEVYGKYNSDIYAVEMINGEWTPATGVPPLLNSAGNEVIQGFCDNGKVLVFIKKAGEGEQVIVSDTFSLDVNIYPQPIATPANGKFGDKDLYYFNDSVFLFSSIRKGGYGGYDIYITEKIKGQWTDPVNLGPKINSPYDERTPFLSTSGSVIYFSSNRAQSIGGYDIFTANYGIERGEWTSSENIGMPISSPGNDMYFRLAVDGRSAILSSDRKESIGGNDLFIAYLKNQVYDQLTRTSRIPFLHKSEEEAIQSVTEAINESPEETAPVAERKPEIKNVKTRELVISPLFYNLNESATTGKNAETLKNILDMMTIYPLSEVVFTGHSQNEGTKAYDLYFSIKRAEQATEYLVRNGIEKSRITTLGVGSNYPLVKTISSPLATKNNNRIVINLTAGEKTDGLKISYSNPVIADYIKDDRAQEYENKKNGLSYKISVVRTKQMYDNPRILTLDDVMVERKGNETDYKYSVGLFSRYNDALEQKNELIRNGFLNVKLEPYLNGRFIDASQIPGLLQEYPDLQVYTKYELR